MNKTAIILSLLMSSVLVSCNYSNDKVKVDSPKDCIAKIIAEDEKLGSERNHACEKKSLEETILDYVSKLEALDFDNCPSKFTSAFKSHIEAWKLTIPIVRNHSELRGEMHDIFKVIESTADSIEFKNAVDQVWATWGDVEKAM